jgi:hypothetical protein
VTSVESDNQVRLFSSDYGPYVRLPAARLAELKQALERHGILYVVEENFISDNGGPYLAYVQLPQHPAPETMSALLEKMDAPC